MNAINWEYVFAVIRLMIVFYVAMGLLCAGLWSIEHIDPTRRTGKKIREAIKVFITWPRYLADHNRRPTS